MRIRLRFRAILAGMVVTSGRLFLGPGDAQPGGNVIANQSLPQKPLLQEWKTPYGVPPFDRIEDAHYLPAFREAMQRQKQENDAIVDNPEVATFTNTIEALERTGKDLTRVSNVFFALFSANSNDSINATESIISPELAAHSDDITLNANLHMR
jgi:peptidyl-dipeptidase Dcp